MDLKYVTTDANGVLVGAKETMLLCAAVDVTTLSEDLDILMVSEDYPAVDEVVLKKISERKETLSRARDAYENVKDCYSERDEEIRSAILEKVLEASEDFYDYVWVCREAVRNEDLKIAAMSLDKLLQIAKSGEAYMKIFHEIIELMPNEWQ